MRLPATGHPLRQALAVTTVACALAACAAGATATNAPSLPACAAESIPPAATLPPGFPTTVPLPPSTYVTGARSNENELVVDAIVPSPLAQAADFMQRELPAAGLEITDSDAEQDEAEASFSGAGVSGRFRLHGITGCNEAVTLSLTVSQG